MKRTLNHIAIVALAVPLTCQIGRSQGSFVNLDFESANVPDIPQFQGGADVAASIGIPGWTPYLGGIPVTTILHNNETLTAAAIAIQGPSWPSQSILQGSYTVLLEPASSPLPPTAAAVGQTGQIPAGTRSIFFYGTGGYTVTFAGQQIPISAVGSGPNYTIFGGDISAFAGQTGELRLQGGGLLDNILFSNQSVPEPTVFALLALGAIMLGLSRRRERRWTALR